jgi:hypothetical protein
MLVYQQFKNRNEVTMNTINLSNDETLFLSVLLASLTEMEVRRVLSDRGLSPHDVDRLAAMHEPTTIKLLEV